MPGELGLPRAAGKGGLPGRGGGGGLPAGAMPAQPGGRGRGEDEADGLLAAPAPPAAAEGEEGGKPELRRAEVAAWVTCGCLNNAAWVIFLTGAEALLTGEAGVVLLAEIIPGFIVYLLGGVLLYRIPYVPRVLTASILSSVSLAFAATARSSGAALAGMAICSVASGLGEVTFLALTSRAPAGALAAWGSGTGFAGIAGAGLWVFLHDVLGYSTKATLLLCSPLPLLQGVAFMSGVRRSVAREGRAVQKKMAVLPTPVRLQVLRQIVVPFMLPLFVVYMFEYSINQALFLPLGITAYRSRPQRACKMYSMLQLSYQVGVFISRTSLYYVKFPYPGLMAGLQVGNFVFGVLQVLHGFIRGGSAPMFLLLFALWEWLLGGGCYVNGMHQMTKLLPAPHQEFALSVVAVANTGGILVAGIVATGLEEALLRHLRAPPFEC